MSSSRRADAKCTAPPVVAWKDEQGVARIPRSMTEVREFERAARAQGEAERAVDLGAWEDALGLPRSGFGERTWAKPAHDVRGADELPLSEANLARAKELRQEFARAGDDTAVGEKVLEDLVGLDMALALSLIDAEAAAIASLHRAVAADPARAPELVQAVERIESRSAAVRHRMQEGLAAAADLRARRLSLKRGAHGK